MKKINFLLSVIIISVLTSCSIQKRHYMKGYNVQWNKKSNTINSAPPVVDDKIVLTASANNELIPVETKQELILNSTTAPEVVQDSCDVLKLKSNKELKVKVMEIGPSVISYKDCDNSDGITKTINKSKVAGITYNNGKEENAEVLREVKTEEPMPQPPSNQNNELPLVTHPSAKAAMIAGPCAFIPVIGWIFAIVAIIHSLVAWFGIEKNPKKYKGKKWALIGGALGMLGLIAGIIIVIVIFGFYL